MFEALKNLLSGGLKPICAPVNGTAVPLSQVPDPTFAQELLGKGAAVIPSDGRIVSPVAGKVLGIFKTCHAVTLQSEEGAEILIHIGIDTVKLAGQCYTPHVVKGDVVKVGDLLIEADLEGIRAAGYDPITAVLVCNTDEYKAVEGITGPIEAGKPLISLRAK